MSTTQAMRVPFDTHFRENGETVYPEGFIFAIAIGKYEKKTNKPTNKQKTLNFATGAFSISF